MFLDWKNQYCENDYTSKTNLHIQNNPYQVTSGIFLRTKKKKFHSLYVNTNCLEKEMATHSSILAWRISWTDEPGEIQSMGSQRVRHDWSDWACMETQKAPNSQSKLKKEEWSWRNQPSWLQNMLQIQYMFFLSTYISALLSGWATVLFNCTKFHFTL